MRPEKNLRKCINGHKYHKSSDCPICPRCEREQAKNNGFLSALVAPARRALVNEGINSVKKLSAYSEKEILALHGMGLSSIPILKEVLYQHDLKFKNTNNVLKENKKIKSNKFNTVGEYLESQPAQTKKSLMALRKLILKTVPNAEELINYNILAYALVKGGKRDKQIMIGGYKTFVGLYPGAGILEKFPKELTKYKVGKGSVQFPNNEPLPVELILKIIRLKIKLLA